MIEPIIFTESTVKIYSFGQKGNDLLEKFKKQPVYQDNKDFYDIEDKTDYGNFTIFIYSKSCEHTQQKFIEKLKDNARDFQPIIIVCFLDEPNKNILSEVNKYATTILMKDDRNRDNFEEVVFNFLHFFYSAIEENDHWYIWNDIMKIFLRHNDQPKQFYGVAIKTMDIDDFQQNLLASIPAHYIHPLYIFNKRNDGFIYHQLSLIENEHIEIIHTSYYGNDIGLFYFK